jgi:predicted nucleotidyltransferase component of viral defense system
MSGLTVGWVARHTPRGSGGRDAALIDIAQDLLLARLHDEGMFEHLVFKGGTALRKLYAGNAGRFSTDLDFSVRDPGDDPADITDLLCTEVDGLQIDGFQYTVQDHRGRPTIAYRTPFGTVGNLRTKLDIGPAPWLPPDYRGWIRLPVHDAYALPTALPVMALVENMAEKIARLTRRTPARDVYDLVWIATNSPHSSFDRVLVRRVAILKNWVDQYGLDSPPATWSPVSGATAYDPGRWRQLRSAPDFDEESIGLLAVPPPRLDDLGQQLLSLYDFLAEPDADERQVIAGGANSRSRILDMIRELGGARYAGRVLF